MSGKGREIDSSERLRLTPAHVEAATILGIFLMALAARLPDYMQTPGFTDEVHEVTRAALIAQGKLHSLTNVMPFISSFFNYLIAGVLLIFGPHVWLPRLFVVVVGALTVVAAYLLAREWGGRLAGLVTASMLATNVTHILVNSHIAYSNCVTPLFTTLGIWQFILAVKRGTGVHLLASSAFLALGLLTHPSAVIIIPPLLTYALWRSPRLLNGPSLFAAGAVFLLLYSPMLLYNLGTGLYFVRGVEMSGTFDRTRELGPMVYLENLSGYSLMLVRSLASVVERRPSYAAHLLNPELLLWLGLGLVAIVHDVRRGRPLMLVMVPLGIAAAALFSARSFEPIQPGRYVMPLAVAMLGSIGCLVAAIIEQFTNRASLRVFCTLCVMVVLVGRCAIGLGGYTDNRVVDNPALLAALATIEASRESDNDLVLLDHDLRLRQWGSGTTPAGIMEMLLTIRGIPYTETRIDAEVLRSFSSGRGHLLAVLDSDNTGRLRDRYVLTRLAPLIGKPIRGDEPRHGVYRLVARL